MLVGALAPDMKMLALTVKAALAEPAMAMDTPVAIRESLRMVMTPRKLKFGLDDLDRRLTPGGAGP